MTVLDQKTHILAVSEVATWILTAAVMTFSAVVIGVPLVSVVRAVFNQPPDDAPRKMRRGNQILFLSVLTCWIAVLVWTIITGRLLVGALAFIVVSSVVPTLVVIIKRSRSAGH